MCSPLSHPQLSDPEVDIIQGSYSTPAGETTVFLPSASTFNIMSATLDILLAGGKGQRLAKTDCLVICDSSDCGILTKLS